MHPGGGGHGAESFCVELPLVELVDGAFDPGLPPGAPGQPHGGGGSPVEFPRAVSFAVAFDAAAARGGGQPHGGGGTPERFSIAVELPVAFAPGPPGSGQPHGGAPVRLVSFALVVELTVMFCAQARSCPTVVADVVAAGPVTRLPRAPPRTNTAVSPKIAAIAATVTMPRLVFVIMGSFRERERGRRVIPVFRDGTGISRESLRQRPPLRALRERPPVFPPAETDARGVSASISTVVGSVRWPRGPLPRRSPGRGRWLRRGACEPARCRAVR
jgi:hypothetical protein